MIKSVRPRRWLRGVAKGLIVLVILAAAGGGYRLAKGYATFRAVAFAVHKTRANIIDPNGMTVGDPFSIGLKPEWWHSQWLIVPTTTPTGKIIVLRLFLKQSLLMPHIKRMEVACMGHNPQASAEASAYGLERTPLGLEVKNIPPEVFLGDRPVNLKRWFPGSFR
jgi:hypothetical protein